MKCFTFTNFLRNSDTNWLSLCIARFQKEFFNLRQICETLDVREFFFFLQYPRLLLTPLDTENKIRILLFFFSSAKTVYAIYTCLQLN